MGNLITFFIRQGFHNFKKSLLILLGISLSISTIVGMNFYVNSVQSQYVSQKLTYLGDMEIYNLESEFKYYGDDYYNSYMDINQMVQQRDIDLDSFYFFEFYKLPEYIIYKNYSQINEDPPLKNRDFEYLNLYLLNIDHTFYSSNRFSNYFKVVQGNVPNSENEVLMDYNTVNRLNLSLGVPLNLSTQFYAKMGFYEPLGDSVHPNYKFDLNLTNIIISGSYIPRKSSFDLSKHVFSSNLTKYINTDLEKIPVIEQENLPVFSYSNFNVSFPSPSHPIQQIITQCKEVFIEFPVSSKHILEQTIGNLYIVDRSELKISHIRSYINNLEEELDIIIYRIDSMFYDRQFQVFTTNYIYFELSQSQTDFTNIRLQLQIFNIPIFLFATKIGNTAFNTIIRGRKEELLLLRSKGMSNFIVNLVIVIETLFNSMMLSLFGIAGGFGFFYAGYPYLNNIFDFDFIETLDLTFTYGAIFQGVLISVSLVLVSSISVIIFVNRMQSEKLLSEMGSNEMDVLYDEKSLYGDEKSTSGLKIIKVMKSFLGNNSEGTKQSDSEQPMDPSTVLDEEKTLIPAKVGEKISKKAPKDMISLYHNMQNEHIDSVNVLERINQKEQPVKLNSKPKKISEVNKKSSSDGKGDIYEDLVKSKEKQLSLSTIIYLVIGIIPIIPYVIVFLANQSFASDILIDIAEGIIKYYVVFEVLTILTPVFIIIALLNIFFLNKPSKLANFSKHVSKILLKKKSYICGMEIVRRKQFKYLISLITLFIGILTYVNFFTISEINQELAIDNIKVGADILGNPENKYYGVDNLHEAKIYQKFIENNQSIHEDFYIDDITFTYKQKLNLLVNPNRQITYFVNLSEYSPIILERGKFNVQSNMEHTLNTIIRKNSKFLNNDSTITHPVVIVNNRFAERFNYEIGDTHEVYLEFINRTQNERMNLTITVQIGAIIDNMPALYTGINTLDLGSQSDDAEDDTCMVFDYSTLRLGDEIHFSDEYQILYDVKKLHPIDDYQVSLTIEQFSTDFFVEFDGFKYYNHEWNDYQFKLASEGIKKIFGLVYFEMILIGVLMAFGLAITILAFQKENKYFNGILLARGFGRTGILKLIISEIGVIFIIASIWGISGGIIFSNLYRFANRLLISDLQTIRFLVFFDPVTLFGIIGTIATMSFLIYYIAFKLESQQSISRYFHKF